MKVKVATTLALATHPIATASAKSSSTSLMTRDVDTHKENKSVAEKQSRLSSPSSFGARFLGKERTLPDVGVLGRRAHGSDNNEHSLFKKHSRTRFLQDSFAASAEAATCLKPDTCEPKLCACVANGGDAYECAHELHAVCQGMTSTARNVDGTAETWTIAGCVDERRLEYYSNIYCPFAGCLATGGTYNQCSCDHFYKPYCEIYGALFPDSQSVQLYCETANCCSAAEDDAGRGICLLEDSASAFKLSEDSSEQAPLIDSDSPGPLTIPSSPDPSVPNQGPPGVSVSAAQTPFASFGLSLTSAFAIMSAFLFS
jgi:hypothetical protein